MPYLTRIATSLLLLLLVSCASLHIEEPQISVIEFVPVKTTGLNSEFELTILITNPNSIDLPIKGMSYTFSINDIGLLKGVAKDIPTIPAYDSAEVTLTLSADMFSASKLLFNFLNKPNKELRYAFTSKIDPAGMLPSFTLTESGILPFKIDK